MKKIFFVFALAFVSLVTMSAQGIQPRDVDFGMLDVVTYHAVPGSDLVYSHTFSNYSHIDLNIPFANPFVIKGNYLSFTISYEDFMWHIVKHQNVTSNPMDQYFDLYICQNDYGTVAGETWVSYHIDPDTGLPVPDSSTVPGSGSWGFSSGYVRFYYYQ
ncbi:hypothetical protein B5F77_14700 [Parabacteroides sp. An277]|uniref:hypothetical protein n=1 Tax=Parabacteroides sp. An277 TaxID=1965619 RepID=UPI000B39369C|nr:hypothetical protein [Parabacteroides sp. An277]OUO49488.1 hypothetical protein B5F77_14700 [Parabacteroides sp. An277]